MFVDAEDLPDAGDLAADICIVGSGPAGLSVLDRLFESRLDIILLESGGLERNDERSAALNRGVSNLENYPFSGARARAFGGTSKIWSGACVPLEPEDFERRAWVPYSGWPIGAEDIAPHMERAREIFCMVDDSGFAARLAASPFHGGDLEARVVQYSGPRDLGQTYRSRVALAENVKCVTGATATALDVAESGKIVTGVRFSDLRHRSLRLRARVIVLAAGGIETPRLLLASGGRERGGLGNDHDVLGRYHMEHPMRSVGTVRLGSAARLVRPFTDLTAAGTAALEGTFGLSAECREADGLLNMHLRAYRYNRLEERSDIVDAKRAAASGGHAAVRALDMVRTLGPRGLPAGAVYGAWHFWNKSLAHAWFDRVRFVAFLEQEPDPQNRITLSGERDVHGCLLPHLGWRESRMMTDSVERSLRAIAAAFEERGLSEVKMGTEAVAHLQDYGGYGLHHMGATRMSDDPRTGVVDASCKVHGVENLYIAGSSVFPTGGAANPTLMISALGLRLGSHLKGTLSNRADCGIFSSRVSE